MKRMRNLALGNWHLLLLRDRADRPSTSAAVSARSRWDLPSTTGTRWVRSSCRIASPTPRPVPRRTPATVAASCARADFRCPSTTGSFGLVTLNGVLEWAGVYAAGNPRALQLQMLGEARRVLAPDGHLAVAIENRFAMESLLGMPDTHTGRDLADRAAALGRQRRHPTAHGRTFPHLPVSPAQLSAAVPRRGVSSARVFDLISSYNDYDFVVDVDDVASYRFLFQQDRVRAFFRLAGRVRQALRQSGPTRCRGWGTPISSSAAPRLPPSSMRSIRSGRPLPPPAPSRALPLRLPGGGGRATHHREPRWQSRHRDGRARHHAPDGRRIGLDSGARACDSSVRTCVPPPASGRRRRVPGAPADGELAIRLGQHGPWEH